MVFLKLHAQILEILSKMFSITYFDQTVVDILLNSHFGLQSTCKRTHLHCVWYLLLCVCCCNTCDCAFCVNILGVFAAFSVSGCIVFMHVWFLDLFPV